MLSHYFQPDAPIEVQDAGLKDWANLLSPFSREAIDHACEHYLRNQPHRRPTPGDIRNRAEAFDQRASRVQTGMSEAQLKVRDWAVERGSLGRDDATQAVMQQRDDYPEWIEADEYQRCVFNVRKHPNFRNDEWKPKGKWK